MRVKMLEVRDRATFIPVVAVELESAEPAERYLLHRAGFGPGRVMILVARLEDGRANYDPFNWTGPSRTMRDAHAAIERRWNALRSGDVVDVEYERGETSAPKVSERVAATPDRPLPSLDPGTPCPRCGRERPVADYCAGCESYT